MWWTISKPKEIRFLSQLHKLYYPESKMIKNFKLFFLLSSCFFILSTSPVKAETGMSQVTNVNQLSDVQPTDWAFQALQSLVERYGCIAGYPNGTFRGNRAITRYEFAAGLNACLERVNESIATATTNTVSKEDLEVLQKLQENFSAELATLRDRVDVLEVRSAKLEASQFSTTTKLRGQAIFAINGGGFNGDSIIDPAGRTIANNDPNTTIIFRAGFDLDTSFNKTDLLKLRLETGSGILALRSEPQGGNNAAGFLEQSLGSALEYSIDPPTDKDIEISRLYYTFKPSQNLAVSIGPNISADDYIDFNSYAKFSFRDFTTQAFVKNYVVLPIEFPSAGAVIDWKPSQGSISVRATYNAADAANPSDRGVILGTAPFINLLYGSPDPNAGGERGLFGDNYQGVVEVEFAPSRDLALRLQYSGGEVFDNRFEAIGANFEFTVAKKLGIFGRYGYSNYDNTNFGDISPNYWMAGVAFRDLFTKGALAGVAVGQPFIANEIGNSTQTNYEAFYNFPVSKNVQITPAIQVIDRAANRNENGTIVTGSLRTTFSF